jgi:hypothetical protein
MPWALKNSRTCGREVGREWAGRAVGAWDVELRVGVEQ